LLRFVLVLYLNCRDARHRMPYESQVLPSLGDPAGGASWA
jgi:hypothetical protein